MKNPSDNILKNILSQSKTIAIIGAKDEENTPVNRVGQYLLEMGYIVIPVHPIRKSVWGIPTYVSITEIPVPIDIVNLFRSPEFCPTHAYEVISLLKPPQVFWMQQGITSPEAVGILQQSEIIAIENLCIMVEHKRLVSTMA